MRHDTTIRFETDFLRRNFMGPNCLLWLDELLQHIELGDVRRVLDLGCGTGLTSMSLASKTAAHIVAYDLWIAPTDNFERFRRFGLEDRILPVHGEAQAMPFAKGYFQAAFCIDAYPYFGDKEGFLETCLAPLIEPGGLLAIAVPGLKKDFVGGVPEELRPFWQDEMHMYSGDWWQDMLERSPAVRLEQRFSMACHEQAWLDWLACEHPYAVRDRDMMRAEAGNHFDTIGLIARVV